MIKQIRERIKNINDIAYQLDSECIVFDFIKVDEKDSNVSYHNSENIIKRLFERHVSERSLLVSGLVTPAKKDEFVRTLKNFGKAITNIDVYQTWYSQYFISNVGGFYVINGFFTTTQTPQVINLGYDLAHKIIGTLNTFDTQQIKRSDLKPLLDLIYFWQPVKASKFWQTKIVNLTDSDQQQKVETFLAESYQKETQKIINSFANGRALSSVQAVDLTNMLKSSESTNGKQLKPEMQTILAYLADQIKE